MSWSTVVTGTPENIHEELDKTELPDYADKTPEHAKQLEIAKDTAHHLVNHEDVKSAETLHVSLAGHNYRDTTKAKTVNNVSVGVTTLRD